MTMSHAVAHHPTDLPHLGVTAEVLAAFRPEAPDMGLSFMAFEASCVAV